MTQRMYSLAVADDPAPDYPAAHSMDTSWFAIDNDGHVALFETGESGCVPEEAYTDEGYSMQEEVRGLPASGFKFDPAGYRESQWRDHVEIDDDLPAELELYMFVSDLVPTKDLLARLDAEEMQATTCKAYKVRARDRAALAELHARAACLGCYRNWDGEGAVEIATHGIYRYEHTCENWIAGPYARAVVPAQPLTIDQIPQSIRDVAVAYDGRFADTPKLQPAEHWECSSWEPGWLSSDGKTARPFPDQMESWAEQAEDNDTTDGGEIKFVNEPLEIEKEPKARWWK
jgi:hypothetical protein